MKTRKVILSVVFMAGTMSSNLTSAATVGIISSDAFTDGSYCHMKFAAIREETLASSHPVLKDPSTGDIIDFYGSCDHDPLGKDEIRSQLRQLRYRRAHDYMD